MTSISTSGLEKYKVDYLFLLIGTNTLPNYVAAKTLLHEGGTACLVHTNGTKDYAEFLRDVLGISNTEMLSLDNYEADAFEIQERIFQEANSHKNKRLGLNYTGGTKAMAVHAYRALLKVKPDAIFSYLDSRKLEMCIDREDQERIHEKVKEKVFLDVLIKMHGLSFKSGEESREEPAEKAEEPAEKAEEPAEKAAQALASLYASDKAVGEAWSWWCAEVLNHQAKKTNGKWKSKTDLDNLVLKLPLETPAEHLPNIEKIFDIWQKHLGVSGTELSLKTAAQTAKFDKAEQVCEWLSGIWLEHYVLQQVKAISNEYGIHDSKLSLKPYEKNASNHKFEFDVAFMRDYQLFALSCTTDSKELCKLKLFEAYLRARQMGGDEARVALVCCSEKPEDLKKQLEVVTGDRKIAVFGREHLANLSGEIAKWIKELDDEAK